MKYLGKRQAGLTHSSSQISKNVCIMKGEVIPQECQASTF